MTTKEILSTYKNIAVVGFSEKPNRDSHEITMQIKSYGYNVIGVNPALAGKIINGVKCYGNLAEIDEHIDIVDIFRRSEFIAGIVEEANNMKNKPKVIWAQLGITSSEAAELAYKYGFQYVENKCIFVEYKLNFNK